MSQLNNVSFGRVKPTTVQSEINSKKTDDVSHKHSSSNTAAKILVSGLAISGVIGLALLAVKKKQIPNLSVEAFKEAGNKFVKGKAFSPNGEPFTGVVNHITKNGRQHSMEYVGGVLKEVKNNQKVFDGSFLNISSKKYNYDESGKLVSLVKEILSTKVGSIKKTINVAETKAKGLKTYNERKAQKAAEELKKAKNEQLCKNLDKHLSKKTEINAEKIDEQFDVKNPKLEKLNKYYARLEKNSELKNKKHAEKQKRIELWEEDPQKAVEMKKHQEKLAKRQQKEAIRIKYYAGV